MAVNDLLVLAGEGGTSMMYVADPSATLDTALAGLTYDADLTGAALDDLQDAGFISEDGLTSGREFETTPLPAYGTKSPVRVFNTRDDRTFTINMLETNPVSIAVYDTKPLSGVTVTEGVITSTSGEASGSASYSLVFDIVDGTRGMGRIIVPRADVTAVTERNIRGGQAIIRGVTFTAKPVDIGGTVIAVKEMWYAAALDTTP